MNVKTLIMININCKYVSSIFHEELYSLTPLNMSRNSLGEFIVCDINCAYLKGLEILEIVDLNNKDIKHFSLVCLLIRVI